MKSIYDKALEYLKPFRWEDEKAKEAYELLKQALEKAQKQEKLLGLYKEVNNKSKELITLAEHDSWSWKLHNDIQDIQYKIKELEK